MLGLDARQIAQAHYLAVTLAELLGDEPEALGLAALLSFSLSRAGARDATVFVPLEEQDPQAWDHAHAGLAALDAIGSAAIGRFRPAWATRAHPARGGRP